MMAEMPSVIWFEKLRRDDVPRVGGKNASLGEMVSGLATKGIRVPPGFATTADAYWRFVDENGLRERIALTLGDLAANRMTLAEAGQSIRRSFLRGEWPKEMADAIAASYRELCQCAGRSDAAVAVRSSATAEDLPDASCGALEVATDTSAHQRLSRTEVHPALCGARKPSAGRNADIHLVAPKSTLVGACDDSPVRNWHLSVEAAPVGDVSCGS